MAYADPPYPGCAWMYKDQPSYAGEVDHVELIARLRTYDGWALSTKRAALRWLLPLCPEEAHVCPWVKPIGVSSSNYGLSGAWEPLIVMPGRELQPGFRDWLSTPPARGGGDLIGRKPLAFCAFLFRSLGLLPGDQLDDLYPGTGIIGRSWRELSRCCSGDAFRAALDDASRPGMRDASMPAPSDASLAADGDASLVARADGSDPSLLEPPHVSSAGMADALLEDLDDA